MNYSADKQSTMRPATTLRSFGMQTWGSAHMAGQHHPHRVNLLSVASAHDAGGRHAIVPNKGSRSWPPPLNALCRPKPPSPKPSRRFRAYTISPPISSNAISTPDGPSKPAFIDPRGSWTYGQLADRVERFGRVLRKLGIAREQRILVCLLDIDRLADGVSRRHQGRRRRHSGQHAADRRRLPFHAQRQPRQAVGRVGGALSEIRQSHRIRARTSST